MESNWAAEHLQVIRTLMERSAIYRRALSPVTLLVGGLGTVAGLVGWRLQIALDVRFAGYWLGVSALALAGAYFLIRRQAVKDGEPFWSPPTRRVTQALVPAFFAGFVGAVALLGSLYRGRDLVHWLPPIWMVLYGCAIHAAGFFMPRGIRLFGWGFILCGCGLLLILTSQKDPTKLVSPHLVMAAFFGCLHLAYGVYLHFTEKRKNEA